MRKIKTLLMIVVLGMLFISCSDEVIVNPSVDKEKLELLYTASNTDTLQVAVVTVGDRKTYYDITTPDRPVPVLTVMIDTPVQLLIAGLFLLVGFGIGAAVFTD